MAVDRLAANATDPSVDGALLAWHEPGAQGIILRGDAGGRVAGTHPAVGGGRQAVLNGGAIHVNHTTGSPVAVAIPAPGADAIAVSASWVAWRAHADGLDTIYAARLSDPRPQPVLRADELGRPALEGDRLVFHHAGRSAGRIVLADLSEGRRRTIRRERRALLLNPSLHEGRLLYVRAVYSRQELLIGSLGRRSTRRDDRLWRMVPTGRRDAGHEPGKRHHRHGHPRRMWARPPRDLSPTLWTTALAADAAYVTRLRQRAGSAPDAEILRVSR